MKPIFYCVILLSLSAGNGLQNETQHTDHHQPTTVPQNGLANIRRYLPTHKDSRRWFMELIPPLHHHHYPPQNATSIAIRTKRAIVPNLLELIKPHSDHPIATIVELAQSVHLLLAEFFHLWQNIHQLLLLPFGCVTILLRLLASPLLIIPGILGFLIKVIGTVFVVAIAFLSGGLYRAIIIGLIALKNILPIPRLLSIVLSFWIIKFLLGDICMLIGKLIKLGTVGGSLELQKPFNRFASLFAEILKSKLHQLPIKLFLQLPKQKLLEYFAIEQQRPSFHRVFLKIFLVILTLPLRLLVPPAIPIIDTTIRVILNIIDDIWTSIIGANQSLHPYLSSKTAGEKIHSLLKHLDRVIGVLKVVSARLNTNSGQKFYAFLRLVYRVFTAIPRLLVSLLFFPLQIIIRFVDKLLGIAPGQSKLEHALTIIKERITSCPFDDLTTTIPALLNYLMMIKDELVRIGEEVLKNRLQITDFISLIECVLSTLFQKFHPSWKAIVLFSAVFLLAPVFAKLPLFLVLIGLWLAHHFYHLFALPNALAALMLPLWLLRKLLKFLVFLLHKDKVNVYFLRILPLWPFHPFKLLRFISSIIFASIIPLPFRLALWPLETLFQSLLFPLFASVPLIIKKVIEALFPLLTSNWIPLLFKILLLPLEIALLPLRILLLPLKLLLLPFKFLINLPFYIIRVVFEALFPILSSEYIHFLIKIAALPLEILLLPLRLLLLPLRILLLPLKHFIFGPFQSLVEPISLDPPAERVIPIDSPLHEFIRVLLLPFKLLLLPFKIPLFIFNQFVDLLLPGLTSNRHFIVKLLLLPLDLLLLPLRILLLPFKLLKFVVMLPVRLFWKLIGFSPDSLLFELLPKFLPFIVRSIINLLSLPLRLPLKFFQMFFPSTSTDRPVRVFYTIFYSPVKFIFPIITSSLPFVAKLLLSPLEFIFLPLKLLLLPFQLVLLALRIIYWIFSRNLPFLPHLPHLESKSVFDVHPFGLLHKIIYFVFRLLFPVLTSSLPWVVKVLSLPLEFLLLPLRILLLPFKAIVNLLFFTFLKLVTFLFPPSFAILHKMPIFTSTLSLFVKLLLLPLEILSLPFKSSPLPFNFIMKLLHRPIFDILKFPLNALFPFVTSTHPFVVKLLLLPFDLLGLPLRLLQLPFKFIFGLPFVLFPALSVLHKIVELPFKLLLPLTISSLPFLIKLLVLPFDLLLLPLRLLLLPFKLLFKFRPAVVFDFLVKPLFSLAPLHLLPFHLLKLPFKLLFPVLTLGLPLLVLPFLLLPLLSSGFPFLLLLPLLLIGFPIITIPILLLPLIKFVLPFFVKLLQLPLKLLHFPPFPLLDIWLPNGPLLLKLLLSPLLLPFKLLLTGPKYILSQFPIFSGLFPLLKPLFFPFALLPKLIRLTLEHLFPILQQNNSLLLRLLLLPFDLLLLPLKLFLLPFKLLLEVLHHILPHLPIVSGLYHLLKPFFSPFTHLSEFIKWILGYLFPVFRSNHSLLLTLPMIPFDLLLLPLRLLLLPFKLLQKVVENIVPHLPIVSGLYHILKPFLFPFVHFTTLIKWLLEYLFPVFQPNHSLLLTLPLLPFHLLLLPLRLLLLPFKLLLEVPKYLKHHFPIFATFSHLLTPFLLPFIHLPKLLKSILEYLFPILRPNRSLLLKLLLIPFDVFFLPLRLLLLPFKLISIVWHHLPIFSGLKHLIEIPIGLLFPVLTTTYPLIVKLLLLPFDFLLLPLRLLLIPFKLPYHIFRNFVGPLYDSKLPFLPPIPPTLEKLLNDYVIPLINFVKLIISTLFPVFFSNDSWLVKLLFLLADLVLLPLRLVLLPIKLLNAFLENIKFGLMPTYIPPAWYPIIVSLVHLFKPIWFPFIFLYRLIRAAIMAIFPISRPSQSLLMRLVLIPFDLLFLPLRLLFSPFKLLSIVFKHGLTYLPNFVTVTIDFLFPILTSSLPLLVKLLLSPIDFVFLPLKVLLIPLKLIWMLIPFEPHLPIFDHFKPLLLPLVHLPKLVKLLLEYLFPVLRPDRSILVKLLLIPLDVLLLPLRLLFLPFKLLFYVFLRILQGPVHDFHNFPFWSSPVIEDTSTLPFLHSLFKQILKLLFLPITTLFPVLFTDYPLLVKLLLLPLDFLLLPLRLIKLPFAFFHLLVSIINAILHKLPQFTSFDILKLPIISQLFHPKSLILGAVTFILKTIKLFDSILLLPLRQVYTFLSRLPSVLLPLPFDVIFSAPHELLLSPFRKFVKFHKIILDVVNYILSKLSSLFVHPFKPLILSPLEMLQNRLPGLIDHLFTVSTLFRPMTYVVILFLPIPLLFKLLLLLSLSKYTIFAPFTILSNIRQITPHILLAGALALLPIPILFKIILLFKIIQRIFHIQQIAVVKGLLPHGLGSKLKPE